MRWLVYLFDPNAFGAGWVKIGELIGSPGDTIRTGASVGILKARQAPGSSAIGYWHPETGKFERYYLAGGTNLIQF